MCDFGDGGDVAHLERLRAGRFHQHRLGVRLEQAFDCSADQRIEIADLDAVAGEHAVAEIARRAVDVIGHQHMIAGAQHREQGGGDRRQPRRRKANACALRAFQRHQHVLQRACGRRAVTSVGEFGAVGVQVLGGRIEHGRTVVHGRVDEPPLSLGVTARGDQSGFGFLRVGWTVVRKAHAFALSKTLCRSHNLIAKTQPRGGSGPGELITRYRRRQSTP